jgi:hypothetical protein
MTDLAPESHRQVPAASPASPGTGCQLRADEFIGWPGRSPARTPSAPARSAYLPRPDQLARSIRKPTRPSVRSSNSLTAAACGSSACQFSVTSLTPVWRSASWTRRTTPMSNVYRLGAEQGPGVQCLRRPRLAGGTGIWDCGGTHRTSMACPDLVWREPADLNTKIRALERPLPPFVWTKTAEQSSRKPTVQTASSSRHSLSTWSRSRRPA